MSSDACCDETTWRRLVSRRRLLRGGAGAALGLATAPQLAGAARDVESGRVVMERGQLVNGSFVNPLVEVYGEVEIGRRSFVAGNTILYAAEGRRISLGDE